MTTINFKDFYNEFVHFSENEKLPILFDSVIAAIKASYTCFMLCNQVPIWATTPSHEVYFLVNGGSKGYKIVLSFTFGNISGLTVKYRKTDVYKIGTLHTDSNLIYPFLCDSVTISLTTYKGSMRVIVTILFGESFKNSDIKDVFKYQTIRNGSDTDIYNVTGDLDLKFSKYLFECFMSGDHVNRRNISLSRHYSFLSSIRDSILDRRFAICDEEEFPSLKPSVTQMNAIFGAPKVDINYEAPIEAFFGEVDKRLEQFPGQVSDHIDSVIKNNLSCGTEYVSRGTKIACFNMCIASTGYYLYNGDLTARNIALASGAVCAFMFAPDILAFVQEALATKENEVPMAVVQFGYEEIESQAKRIWEWFCNFNPNKQFKVLKEYGYLLINFERIKEGIMSILNWLLEMVDYVTMKLLSRRVIPSSWYESTTKEKELLNFVERVDKFSDDLVSGTVPFSRSSYCIIKDLLEEYTRTQLSTNKSSGKGVILDKCFKKLMHLKDKFGPMEGEDGKNRIEPTSILFRGGPGVQKSFLMDLFIENVLAGHKKEEPDIQIYVNPNFSNNCQKGGLNAGLDVFYRNISNKYHDGGETHPTVWVYDDFGQAKDVAGVQENEYMELIAAKNSRPMQLHMSAVDDKKDCYFRSSFIVATTNVTQFKPESVTSVGAVNRRWDIDLIVCAKPEFSVDPTADMWHRKFDPKKVPSKELPGGEIVMDLKPGMYDLHRITWNEEGRVDLGTMTFKELVEKSYALRKKYEAIYVENKKRMSDVTAEMRAYLVEKGLLTEEDIVEEQFGSIDDLPEKETHARKFFAYIESIYGRLKQNYNTLWNDVVLKYKTQIVNLVFRADYALAVKLMREDFQMLPCDVGLKEALEEDLCKDYSLIRDIRSKIDEYKYSLGFVGIVLTFFGIRRLVNGAVPSCETQSTGGVLPSKTQPMRNIQDIAKEYGKTHAVTQLGLNEDPNGDAVSDKVIRKNSCAVVAQGKHLGQCVFIAGTLALLPCHFIRRFDAWVREGKVDNDSALVTFISNSGYGDKYTHHSASIKEILSGVLYSQHMENQDLVAVRLPDHFPSRANISSHFRYKNQHRNEYNSVCMKIAVHAQKRMPNIITMVSSAVRVVNHQVKDVDGVLRMLPESWRAKMRTSVGHCGGLYCELNRNVSQKILGMHVAGDELQNTAIFTPVYREWVEELILIEVNDKTNPLVLNQIEDESFDLDLISEPQIGFEHFNAVCNIAPVAQVTKSSWIKSPITGVLQEATMLPSILHPVKRVVENEAILVDPKVKASRKYNTTTGVFVDPEILKDITASEIDFYSTTEVNVVERRTLDDVEAIIGVSYEPDLNPMVRRTSPGFPYLFDRKGLQGKSYWFGSDGEFTLDRPQTVQFLETVKEQEVMMQKGVLPKFIMVDNLKDELRPRHKIDDVSTRLFSAAPMDLNRHFRKYFGMFTAWCIKNRIHNSFCIGINPYSNEWDLLGRKLCSTSNEINAGDFAGFDSKHNPRVIRACLDIIDWFYKDTSEDDRVVRHVLWRTLYQTYHISGDVVYGWTTSLSSGHPMTSIINCMCNRIYHKYSFVRLCEPERYNMRLCWEFNKAVCLEVYGDDSLMACIEKYRMLYNERTLPGPMSEVGQEYTPETKRVLDGHIRSIYEVTFLKRYFRYEPILGGFVAPMVIDRIKEMPNWVKKVDSDLNLRDKCPLIARELALHDPKIGVPLIEKLDDALRKYNGEGLTCTNRLALLEEVCNMVVPGAITDFQLLDVFHKTNMISTTNLEIGKAMTSCSLASYPHNVIQEDNTRFSVCQMDEVQTTADNEKSQAKDIAFISDGIENRITLMDAIRDDSFLTDIINNENSNGVSRYLERPVKIVGGYLASTDTATTFAPYDWSLPWTIGVTPQKTDSIMSMKADLVLTLNVNGNPAQQGLYKLVFTYSGGISNGATSTTFEPQWQLSHAGNKYQIVQLFGAYINIGKDTKVVLRVPWKSAHSGVLLAWGTPKWQSVGAFKLYPIFPFSTGTGGSTSASYTLWAHYENIELGGVTITQMADLGGKEQLSMKPSAILDTISFASGTLAKLPLIGNVFGHVSWASNTLAGVARYFGYSKANVISPPQRYVKGFGPYMAVSDGADAGEPMGLIAENRVDNNPGLMGTNADEMSIRFITGVEGWCTAFTFATGAAVDSILATIPVNPSWYSNNVTDGTVTGIVQMSPIAWAARHFAFWRGGLIFRFRFAKTQLHSGRLMVAVVYGNTELGALQNATIQNSWSTYRDIIDLRERDEIEITVPYINSRPWSDCSTGVTTSIGNIQVVIIDPLVAPALVSSTISCLVTVRGAEDFALASPVQNSFCPIVPSSYQMADIEGPNRPQEIISKCIGDTSLIDKSMRAMEICMGEPITSFRQLIKRFSPISTTATAVLTTNVYKLLPFASYIYKSNGTVVQGTVANTTRDLFTELNNIYALSRGGVRIQFLPGSFNTTQGLYVALDRETYQAATINNVVTSSVGTMANFLYYASGDGLGYSPNMSNGAGYTIPQNTATISRICGLNNITSVNSISYGVDYPDTNQLKFIQQGGSAVNYYLLRAGADDISFGCFVSIPPMWGDPSPPA